MKNPTIFKNTILIFSCILLTVLGLTILDADLNADAATTIGLNINTGNITSSGTITSQDLTVQKEGNATLTVYSNIDSTTTDSKLLVVQKGISPSELFSVDEDGDVAIANDLAVTGNITGTWQGTPVTTQYGGTGQNWSAITQGNLPYFSGTGTLSNLAPGTAGQFLKSQGTGADPAWANVTRSATFVVAASDSSDLSKQQADYVCNGVDDQDTISDAINALPDNGGKVILMEGNYYLDITYPSAIEITSNNITFTGSGANTVLVHNSGTFDGLIRVRGTSTVDPIENVIVENMKILGSRTGGDGISISYGENCAVRNVLVVDIYEEGIVAYNSNRITISDNKLVNTGETLNPPLELFDTKHSWMKNNYIEGTGSGTRGILITGDSSTPSPNNPSEYNIIDSNIIYDTDLMGIDIEQNSQYNTISNNIVIDSDSDGILVGGGSTLNSYINNEIINSTNYGMNLSTSHSMVSRNIIKTTGAGYAGIRIYQKNGNTIIGNRIEYAGKDGIALNKVTESTIANNVVKYSQEDGINLYNGCQEVVITGNTAIDNGQAATNTHSGLSLYSYGSSYTSENLITGNRFSGAQQKNGVEIGSGCTNNQILHNDVSGSGTLGIGDAGTSTVKRDNLGYTTENSGTTTITAGQTSVNVTHNLDDTPTRVILTPTTDTAGKRYWVSSKGATTFTITIDSTHTADISFDWQAQVGEGN